MSREGLFREGLFVVSLYADGRGRGARCPMKRMALFPSGPVTGAETVGIVLHLLQVQTDLLMGLLNRFEEMQEVGSFDEDGLTVGETEGGQGFIFDTSA